MRYLLAGAAMLAAAPASAEILTLGAEGSVAEAADRLEAAVEAAGATVFARIDHGGSATPAGLDLPPAELVIFGNPEVGTSAMQEDMRAGLFLPLKILVYEGEDGTTLAYETPAASFEALDIPADARVLERMSGALGTFAAAASRESFED